MSINQGLPFGNGAHQCSNGRASPLCYSRMATSDAIDRARVDAHNGATLTVQSGVAYAVSFVVVYGGWGL
jgi:hypothetical protein